MAKGSNGRSKAAKWTDSSAIRPFCQRRRCRTRPSQTTESIPDRLLDRLMSGLALEVIRQHGLDTRFMHFDTTTLSFYGAYESEGFSAMSDDIAPPPKVTYGHPEKRSCGPPAACGVARSLKWRVLFRRIVRLAAGPHLRFQGITRVAGKNSYNWTKVGDLVDSPMQLRFPGS